MADLGAIGTRARGKPFYCADEWRPKKKDRIRPYMRAQLVTGTFVRTKVETRTPGHYRYVPFYMNPLVVSVDPCNGLIAGTTHENGNPAPFKVVHLFHRPNQMKVRSTISDSNGAFSFPCVAKETTYFVLSLDNAAGQPALNAAIADYITPDPMP